MSEAKRKSQKTRGLQRQVRLFLTCVHACDDEGGTTESLQSYLIKEKPIMESNAHIVEYWKTQPEVLEAC